MLSTATNAEYADCSHKLHEYHSTHFAQHHFPKSDTKSVQPRQRLILYPDNNKYSMECTN